MRHKLTPAFVAEPPLPEPGRDRIVYWEGNFGLMVTSKGHKSFVVQYRAGRRSRRMSLKAGLNLRDARKEAKAILGAVARGGDPLTDKRKAAAASTSTLKAIFENYMKRDGTKLRSADRRRADFERLVLPELGSRQIADIKRSDIVKLLDKVEDENGPHSAQAALTYLSKLFNWYASRDDDFRSPIRRGMGRTKASEYARDRILSDDELRAVWRTSESSDRPFERLVRILLLTATRRAEAARMARTELAGNDWIIPAERMKAKREHVVPLSKAAKAIIDDKPKLSPFVFGHTGSRPITGFSDFKADFDKACGVTGWRLHDLRRTARSLMSRAGIAPDIAERCLAHTIGGVRGTYDRYAYYDEKAHAFEALAGLIDRIVNPVENIIQMHTAGNSG